jgi:hypothetical protein
MPADLVTDEACSWVAGNTAVIVQYGSNRSTDRDPSETGDRGDVAGQPVPHRAGPNGTAQIMMSAGEVGAPSCE